MKKKYNLTRYEGSRKKFQREYFFLHWSKEVAAIAGMWGWSRYSFLTDLCASQSGIKCQPERSEIRTFAMCIKWVFLHPEIPHRIIFNPVVNSQWFFKLPHVQIDFTQNWCNGCKIKDVNIVIKVGWWQMSIFF